MPKSEPVPVLKSADNKDALTQLPATISRTIKSHLEALVEPFSNAPKLNARIKRIFKKPQ